MWIASELSFIGLVGLYESRPAAQPMQLVLLQHKGYRVCRSIRHPQISGVEALVCVDRIRIELFRFGMNVKPNQPVGFTPIGYQQAAN